MAVLINKAFIFIITTYSVIAWSNAEANETLDRFRDAYVVSMESEDTSPLTRFYAESFRLMPEFYPTVWGGAHAEDYFAEVFESINVIDYQRNETEIRDLGRFVYEIGEFALTIKLQDAKQRDIAGKYLNLWERNASDQLQLIADIWNYDHAIDFVDQLKPESVPAEQVALKSHLPPNTPARFELAAFNAFAENIIAQRRGDVWAMFYSDDAILLPHHRPPVTGRNELDRYFIDHANELPAFEKLHTRNDRVEDLGEYVIEFSNGSASWVIGADSGVSTGKHIRIWRRQPHGGLRIFRAVLAYD